MDWLMDGISRVVKVLNPAGTHTVALSVEETGQANIAAKYNI